MDLRSYIRSGQSINHGHLKFWPISFILKFSHFISRFHFVMLRQPVGLHCSVLVLLCIPFHFCVDLFKNNTQTY